MKISQRSIDAVRETANIVEVASEFTALKRQGARFGGLCPYPDHQEKTPSFSVSPDQGFYYCFGCLAADERIWTHKGLISIGAVEIGDTVIGGDGRPETITDKVFKSAPTIRIQTGAAKEGIELTPDHWCVFVKKEEALRCIHRVHRRSASGEDLRFSSRHRRVDDEPSLSIEHASEVREGDFWVYPVISEDERHDTELPGEHIVKPYTKGPRTRRITGLPVNVDTAWLYGIWLAEGSLYRGGLKWSFGLHEADTLASRVIRVLKDEFGRSSTLSKRPEKSICEVTCSSTDLAALFGYWFGRGCANKRIPVQALNWSRGAQTALIQGHSDGDGHTAKGVTSIGTISEELAYGIFALCVQTGQVCSLSSVPAYKGSDGVSHRQAYYVHTLSKESIRGFFADIDGVNYFFSVVRSVRGERDEPTTVVDITTTGSHTFLTKMGATHNCQRGGDAIKLVTDLKSFSFIDAITYLAERSGVELEYEGSAADSQAARERNQRRRNIHKALAAAAIYYHKYLIQSKSPDAESARNYLKQRGLSDSTIEEFRLGVAPPRGSSGFMAVVRKFGLDRGTLDAAGLLSSGGRERFAGRITFPISDRRGRVVGFGARALGDDHPKYLNTPETEIFAKRDLLYGFPQVTDAIRKERAALVVEGYTDVLMLYQSGIKNAVATLGTATTPAHLRTLSGYADKIYALFDPDAAGEKAIERAAATAAELKLDLRVLRLSKDPADWLLQHPPEEFTELLAGAVPILEYGIRRIVERTRGSDAMDRSRAVPEIKELVREISDPVLHREAIRIATEALGVGPEVFRQVRQAPRATSGGNSRSRPASSSPQLQAGRELLALILARPDLAAKPLADGIAAPDLPEPLALAPEDFADEEQRQLFAVLRDHAGDDLAGFLRDERVRPLMDLVAALSAEGERLYPSEVALRETWLRLAILSRQQAKRDTSDYDAKDRLQGEIRTLRQALRAITADPS